MNCLPASGRGRDFTVNKIKDLATTRKNVQLVTKWKGQQVLGRGEKENIKGSALPCVSQPAEHQR